MKLRLRAYASDGAIDLIVSPRDQNVVLSFAGSEHATNNCGDLSRCFSARENHFGKTLAQRPMMIDFREAEIFRRQMTQPLDCILDRNSACLQPFEQPPDIPFFHLILFSGKRGVK